MAMTLEHYYIFAFIVLWPMIVIFRRAGLSPAWAALLLVPPAGFILCLMALVSRKWPAMARGA